MKIGIISDTHDNTAGLAWAVEYLNQQNCRLAFHAGDIINPGNMHFLKNTFKGELHFVFGNNDGDRARLLKNALSADNFVCHFESMDEVFEGKRIFMHHFSDVAELVAQNDLFDLVIGGHDHQYRTIQYGKTLFVNPGAMSLTDSFLGRADASGKSFVILDLETMEAERVIVPQE